MRTVGAHHTGGAEDRVMADDEKPLVLGKEYSDECDG